MPYPFQTTGLVTGSISSGSYFSESDNELFYNDPTRDFWFGFSPFDVTEVSVYDFSDNQLAWNIVDDIVEYKTLTYSYENEKDQIVQYSYNQFVSNVILYKNDKILENITQHLIELGIGNGDYKMVYNHTRLMAGGPDNLLSIKDISPSRKELKIIPTGTERIRFDAFCKKKFQIKDVSSLLIQLTNNCPYDDLYRNVKDQYQAAISFLQTIFFLQTDGDVLRFLKNLYEDFVKYVNMSSADIALGESPDRVKRIQGIRTYFQNWLRSNNDTISSFDTLSTKFIEYVILRIEKQFAPYAAQRGADFLSAKQFIYDFFIKYFYQSVVNPLEESYVNKYETYLKNALNFGDARYVLILNTDSIEENGENVLLVKLTEELPSDIKLRDRCWISNLGMVPYVFQVSVKGTISNKTVRISSPNFLVQSMDVNVKNINRLYTAEDLRQETSEKSDDIVMQKKITELDVDYTTFNNFILFSSAGNRLSVFKNKIIDWTVLSSSLVTLQTNTASAYPYYSSELDELESQMSEVVESFDGYEAYLFKSNNYTYNLNSNTWNSSSFVAEMDSDAADYDRNNGDSLINNTPEFIVADTENDEYLTFLSMIGHYFDNLYLYIKSMPLERAAKNQISGSMSTNMLKDMLGSFGWNIDDILSDRDSDKVHLNEFSGGTNAMSDTERMRAIWNRILVTLPQLYKTKGTEECTRLILACHGIPSNLISVKEYGGIDYSVGTKISYIQNEKVFMMHFTPSYAYWQVPMPHKTKTVEFKFAFDDYTNYAFGADVPLVWYLPTPDDNGTSQWRMGVKKGRGKFDGKVYFSINPSGSTGPVIELTSSTLPLFSGDIFSVMLRRNYPSAVFVTSSLILEDYIPTKYDLHVQRNESGRVVFKSTSSTILYKEYNQGFSDISKPLGNRILFGNWYSSASAMGNSFVGVLDKIRLWKNPIEDSDFEDHVNDLNSYSLHSSSVDNSLQENLYFVSDVNYPIDVANPQYVTGSASGSSGAVYFPNANEFYTALSSWPSLGETYTGSIISSSVSQSSWIPYNSHSFISGAHVLFFNGIWQNVSHVLSSDSCSYVTNSVYPYQYSPCNINQTYTVGTYGPNKFKNNKIKKVEYTLDVRLDNLYSSTSPAETLVSADSNIFGFFTDPQDFKNKDVVHYFGNRGILDSIADPEALYSSSYIGLTDSRNRYAKGVNKKTLFTELISLNKFYFDKSIFNTIKSVAPARANTLTGVLIEPSIIERPKYQHKTITSDTVTNYDYMSVIGDIQSEACELLWTEFVDDNNSSSVVKDYPQEYYNYVAQKNQNPGLMEPDWYINLKNLKEIVSYNGFEYLLDDYNRILASNSMPPNYTAPVNLTAISNPNVIYPPNYGGWYMNDFLDDYQLGWFADREGAYRNDSIIPDGVNPSGATNQATMENCPSGSALYYLLKRWRKYDIFSKTGPHVHDTNPRDDLYNTASVYLYDIIHVTENFYKNLIYMTDNQPIEVSDPSSVYQHGYGYHHLPNTFIGTANDVRSNIKAVPVPGGSETDLSYYIDYSNGGYYEVFTGYPRNHYTHKMELISPTRIPIRLNVTSSVFIKGRQTINTTIDTGSLGDGSLPVTSINVSNVNVVSGDNVLN